MPGRSTQSLAVMRRIFAAIAILALLTGAGVERRAAPHQLDEWMTYYYLDPRPDEVPEVLREIAKQGLFNNDDAQAPLSGFFAEVFRANPDRLAEWIKPFRGVPDRHVIYSGLWMANSKQGKAALESLAKAARADEGKRLHALAVSVPPTLQAMSIDSPAALDFLWGSFMASGSEEPVLRIISQMKRANTKGNIAETLIGGAAQWSVSANARQHPKVLRIVTASVATSDAETTSILKGIIAGIDREKNKK